MSQDSNKPAGRKTGAQNAGKPSTAPSQEAASPFLSPSGPKEGIDEAKVARAKRLLQQDGYPSEKVLRSVAQHLARNWPDADADDSSARSRQ